MTARVDQRATGRGATGVAGEAASGRAYQREVFGVNDGSMERM